MALFLGVDGGNTKTLALVATADGRIIGSGRAASSDIYGGASEDAALDEIDAAVGEALAAAKATKADLEVSSFCLAGADWPEDIAILHQRLGQRGYAGCIVSNDAAGCLRAGTADGVGIVLACGTGVAAGACNADGKAWHSGFWQEPLGGGEMGVRALRAASRAQIGIDPPTALTASLLRHFGAASLEQVLRKVHARRNQFGSREFAGLAPLVLDAADQGDAAALAIITAIGAGLAAYARAAARQVGLDIGSAPLVLTGGLFRHTSPLLIGGIAHDLGLPLAALTISRQDPALGALLIAFDACGAAPDLTPQPET